MTGEAINAANNTSLTNSATVNVDNVQPTVSISQVNDKNPTGKGNNAPVQLLVTPTVGPSGMFQFECVDGSDQTSSFTADPNDPGSYLMSVQNYVSSVVTCTAESNAINPQGVHNSGSDSFTVPAYDSSAVSFAKIVDPLIKKEVRKRIRVDYHYVTRRKKDGKKVRVKAGGHFVTKTVVKYVEHCAVKKVKGKRRRVCVKPKLQRQDHLLIGHGKTTTIYGQLTPLANGPLSGQTITVVSVPDNGSTTATTIGTATTNAEGSWSMTIPAGPSRTITAEYAGTSTQLPSSASATLTVPAKIKLQVSTRKLPWSGVLTISGRLVGGYVPKDGVAMRLLFRLPGRKQPYAPVSFRTTSKGTFSVRWSWGSGTGAATYPVSVAMTASESDYPFKAATSRAIPVKFGVASP